MSDVERVDMGSQAEASSSSKRDMGSYTSTMKPSDVKALTRKYKIPRDLHPVAVSSEWTMDRLTDEYIGLYEQYFEFAGLRANKGIGSHSRKDRKDSRVLLIFVVSERVCFKCWVAITWEFPRIRPFVQRSEGNGNERALIFFSFFYLLKLLNQEYVARIRGKLIQKLLLNQKCMGYLVRAYYSISLTKYYKDDSCWSADLKSNTTEDVISI
ncbi:hypothetical protein Tco_0892875 [Tanacetum coccineum]|uniref:Uncharacterized protein n=1 Tax=Tanacetum coccineum TaxID=301880 RepID=A0ABQ5CA51_9ASTR